MALSERVELEERVTITCLPPAFHWIRAAPPSGVTLTFVTSAGAVGGGGIGSGGVPAGGWGSTMSVSSLNVAFRLTRRAPKVIVWLPTGTNGGAAVGPTRLG